MQVQQQISKQVYVPRGVQMKLGLEHSRNVAIQEFDGPSVVCEAVRLKLREADDHVCFGDRFSQREFLKRLCFV